MFISNRKHLAIIQEIRHYWSNELDRMRRENQRLKAQLEAKASFEAAQESPLPAPLPAVERPKYGIVHVRSMTSFQTLCGESPVELYARKNSKVEHVISPVPPQQFKLTAQQSWCDDCLG